jgi:hypothetical protein
MTNIWADTYKQIRDPFFQIEDPYTVSEEKKEKEESGEKKHKEGPKEEKGEKEGKEDKPKRWWDDDGDGKGYEKGEVSGKFPKKKVKEEVEQIDELSHNTYSSVAKKQSAKVGALQDAGEDDTEAQNRLDRTKRLRKKSFVGPKAPGARNPYANVKEERDLYSKNDKTEKLDVRKGIKNKVEINPKITEELQAWIDELLDEGYDLSKFTLDEVAEIYEAAEVEQLDEISLKTKMKAYSASRDVDADYNYGSKVHDQGDRIKKAIVKKHGEKAGEHAERAAEVQNFGRGTPRAKPRIEKNRTYRTTKAGSMHGQDQAKLKSDLKKRRNEEYMDEAADTYSMPAKGDAQTQKVDPMAAAKAKAARAKVSKEIADLQVAKQAQRTKVNTNEAVLTYLSNRTPFYEAVYDPKKSKMRPASERTQRVMTDAQRKAAKKEDERVSQIHSKGETVLAGLRPQGKPGKVKTTPDPKPAAPEANRKVKGKEDTLASKADKILKSLKK